MSGEVFEEEIPVVDEHEQEDSRSLQSGRETPGSQSTNVVDEAEDAYEPPAAPSAPRKRQAPAPPEISNGAESAAEMNFVQDAEQILSDLDADLDQLYDQFPPTSELSATEDANVSISTSLYQSPQREAVAATSPLKVMNGTAAAVVQDIIPPTAVADKFPRQAVILSVNTELDAGAPVSHEVYQVYFFN